MVYIWDTVCRLSFSHKHNYHSSWFSLMEYTSLRTTFLMVGNGSCFVNYPCYWLKVNYGYSLIWYPLYLNSQEFDKDHSFRILLGLLSQYVQLGSGLEGLNPDSEVIEVTEQFLMILIIEKSTPNPRLWQRGKAVKVVGSSLPRNCNSVSSDTNYSTHTHAHYAV